MKIFMLALALLQAAPTYVYPVRVQILEVQHHFPMINNGRGNIYDQQLGLQGFDYTSGGCRTFQPNLRDDRYSARWSSTTELVILTSGRECRMTVTRKNVVYVVSKDGRIIGVPIGKPPYGPH